MPSGSRKCQDAAVTRFDAAAIRRFYDRNTPAFARLGQGGAAGAVRRAVWGPGVTDRAQAFHFVDHEIAEQARARLAHRSPIHIVDLGCGVGGSLCYLAARLPMRGTGVTISPVQARHAAARVAAAGLGDRVTIVEGDFCALPPLEPADVAFAIEAFVHGPDPAAFFAEAFRLVLPGGRLVVCDDMRRAAPTGEAGRYLDRFRRGWRVNSLLRRDELRDEAVRAGFTPKQVLDLTPWVEIGRPRDRAIDVFALLLGWLPLDDTRAGHLVGGSALQRCLREGWVGYELAVFER